MSLCDQCYRPGHCCIRFYLGTFGKGLSKDKALNLARMYNDQGSLLPFEPLEKHVDGTWVWTCSKLSKEGRCTIYRHRPVACKFLEPGNPEHALCIHSTPSESGDPTVGIDHDPFR